ncbi:hypothetical protein [Streptomyces sp. NPDC006477]|uniref:hypothetical protein n=1 Tax=Streptomyces sp. NPDC006477 TaxID=3364747 RepID=UPI003698E6A3
MAWPSDYAQVQVKGAWFDPFNRPMKGHVTFEPTTELYDVVGQKIIPPAISGIPLVNGAFSVYLLATNEPNVTPKGWKYRVTVSVLGGGEFMLDVPKDSGTLDITDWKAAQSTTPDQPIPDAYATITALEGERAARIAGDALLIPLAQRGVAGGVATLDGSGKVPTGQMPYVLGEPEGLATLGPDGYVPFEQLHPPVEFSQATPSQVWVIYHDFPGTPTVEVYNNAGEEVDAEIDHVSPTMVTVNCYYPETGTAILRR